VTVRFAPLLLLQERRAQRDGRASTLALASCIEASHVGARLRATAPSIPPLASRTPGRLVAASDKAFRTAATPV